jgi:O-antigen/teichoic acid export membrane protein
VKYFRLANEVSSGSSVGRKWFLLGGWLLCLRGAAMGLSLLQIPLALSNYGVERFGLWASLMAGMGFLAIGDLGLGCALQNRAASALALGQSQVLHAAVSVSARMLFVLAFLYGAALFILWQFTGAVQAIFPGGMIPSEEKKGVVGIFLLAFALGLPASFAQRLALAAQDPKGLILTVLFPPGVILCALWAGKFFPLPWIGFMALCAMATPMGNFLYSRQYLARKQPGGFFLEEAKKILREGILFVPTQISSCLLTSVPPLFVLREFGAQEVAIMNLMGRIVGIPSLAVGQILAPLWATFTRLSALQRGSDIRKLLGQSQSLILVFIFLSSLIMVLAGPWIFFSLAGGQNVPLPSGFLVWSVAAFALQTCTSPAAIVLNGLGRPHGQAIYGTVFVAVTLILIPLLAPTFGLNAVPLAICLGSLLINIPGTLFDLQKTIWSKPITMKPEPKD